MQPFDLGMLLEMLTYKRPAGSYAELQFLGRYLPECATIDDYGNYHATIGESPILWSCHTDTVHRTDGRQTIAYDPQSGDIRLSRRSRRGRDRSTCLGADDTAGVFLLVSMIRAGVAGHYVFHFGEEIGGDGSHSLATHASEIISDSRFAIALDRRGFSDVITHQMMSRCCSDAFAHSLADQLNAHGLSYKPSDRGMFTDTAHYVDIIGECTNLSVGYANEHTSRETVNARHLESLLTALCALDPSALVDSRKPGDDDYQQYLWRPQAAEMESCEYCGAMYEPFHSWATDKDRYCSPDCEDRAIADFHGVTYLDPTYEDVARALLQGKDK